MPDHALPARGSLRSRSAATVSSLTIRQISAVLPPEQPWGLWASRQIIAGVMNAFGPSLHGVQIEPVDLRMADGRRVVGEWVRSTSAADRTPGQAIYYVHGSGFALCSPRTHRRLTGWLSRLTGLPVFCVDYRLAPKYRFPTAADDVRAGWDWLCTEGGFQHDQMVIAGDSAGGHLTVDMLLRADVPHPAAMVLLSPLLDLTFALARAREALRDDPAIRAADAARLINLYCIGADMTDARLTLDVAGGRPMPPSLIQAGGAEMLQSDARTLVADIRAAGGTGELQIWPDQVHVFQALPKIAPEAIPAMRTISAFIAEALQRNAIRAVG
ncbi:MAG: alpha/beta hydrolase [Mycolicibacterium neoaurum]|uniref:alpha/beta hydrolase n=1 Tax=Mycolicibacterium neoaurum TaxID=1795 RepID=UPI002FFB63B6